jgi:UDP-N-acetylglucosamine--N-acetylmuramyl-(pentapeptide) pyrophosphoryl-undecaprenol N-acetylglucosamine transferase
VAKKIEKIHNSKYPTTKTLNIFITGGSQGAKIFGEVVPKAIKLLSKKEREQITVAQQVVKKDLKEVAEIYKKMNVNAEVESFFDDMDSRLKNATLFIGRSGALTVNELLIAGRSAILVPLPIAMEDHQTINASVMADNGAGWIMQQNIFTAESLSNKLKNFIKNPDLLKNAGEQAKKLAVLNASKHLADLVEGEIKK